MARNRKEYHKAYMKKRRATRRCEILKIAGNKCFFCDSEDKLEFHHKDRETKLFTLSGSALDRKWEVILEEVNKCILLCSRCHSDKTKEQYTSGQITAWNKDSGGPRIHGTARAYEEIPCRCEKCKKAKKLYRNKEIGYSEKTM